MDIIVFVDKQVQSSSQLEVKKIEKFWHKSSWYSWIRADWQSIFSTKKFKELFK